MARRGKRPVPVNLPEPEKPIVINPNRIKVRDMRGILLSGCGPHEDKKKKDNKYSCRRKGRDDDSGLYGWGIDADYADYHDVRRFFKVIVIRYLRCSLVVVSSQYGG